MCKCQEKLCRYMSYERFESLIINKELVLSDPLNDWEDEKECYIIKTLKDDPETEKMLKERALEFINDENEVIERIKETKRIKCQSWSKNVDDKKMWEEYSKDSSSVMISTTRQKLCWLGLQLLDIEYDFEEENIQEEIKNLMDEQGILWKKLFQKKRRDYAFEGEVRAVWTRGGKIVRFSRIDELIDSATLDSRADNACISNFENLCKDNQIKIVPSTVQF